MIGAAWRILLPTVLGVGLALLLAANWPEPDDTFAPVVIMYLGAIIGVAAGLTWATVHQDRKADHG